MLRKYNSNIQICLILDMLHPIGSKWYMKMGPNIQYIDEHEP